MKAIKMKKINYLFALLALGLLGAPTLVQAQGAYDYESFNYPGSTSDQVFGINNRGEVVGIGSGSIPYVYDSKKGSFTDVTPVAGYDDTAVIGISDEGVLVGSVTNFGPDWWLDEASGLIIDNKGASTLFDHPDALLSTQARGVNEEGLVTGFRDMPSHLGFDTIIAFVYDPKRNTFTDIIPESDHGQSIAQGINSKGEVVGSAFFYGAEDPCDPGNTDSFVRYGWLRAKDGTVTYFQINGDRTAARGITDSGTIAGFVDDSTSGLFKGFVTELDGSQCQSITIAAGDLLHFPGAFGTFVGGIKNSGEVVGEYYDATTGLNYGYIAWPQ